jgi:two-component system LytT family response regulator
MWNVMIVDDERAAIDELEETLQRIGAPCEVSSCLSVYDALQRLPLVRPDVVFLDISMPGMNGIELADAMQQQGLTAEIVYVTAYREYSLDAFRVGAGDYLLKPIDEERLQMTMNRLGKRLGNTQMQRFKEEAADVRPSIRTFGDVAVIGPAGKVQWSTSKSEELFCYLLMHREVHRDRIIEDVFAHLDVEKATNYAHLCLHHIRRGLKEAGLADCIQIRYTNRRYVTEVRDVWVDCVALMSEGEAEQLIQLYHGDLFQHLDAMWVRPFSERYSNRYVELLQRCIKRSREQGDVRQMAVYERKLKAQTEIDEFE